MGGKITAKSQLQQGSEFNFELPLTIGKGEAKRFEQLASLHSIEFIIIKQPNNRLSLIEQLLPQWQLKYQVVSNINDFPELTVDNDVNKHYILYILADNQLEDHQAIINNF